MSRVSRKKRIRTIFSYLFVAIAFALFWLFKTEILMSIVSVLNSISEAFDSVGG